MNLEEAIKSVDAIIFQKASRHLSPPEVTILQGTWQGMTYDQMAEASQYSLNYLMRDIGPRFWRLLSEVLGEEVGKTNFRSAIEQRLAAASTGKEKKLQVAIASKTLLSDEGSELPSLSAFYGRSEELKTLSTWIKEGCRSLAIRGISGSGKTALARQLVEEVQNQFDCVLWRSFAQPPSLGEILNDLHRLCSPASAPTDDDSLSQIMTYLRSYRCLLVFDNIETILQSGQLVGNYRSGYEAYGDLFERIGEEFHQSCLTIAGLETPRELSLLEGETAPVRTLLLSGLSLSEAQEILKAEGLGDRGSWEALISRYQGNPAALKLAAKLIKDLFNGNVSELLERETSIVGDIGKLLEPTMKRLSSLEREILYWLTIERRPISFSDLESNLAVSISQGELIEVLASLGQRSLIETTKSETGRSLFAVAPMVMEYVTSEMVEQISGKVSYRQKPLRHQWNSFEDTIELTPLPQQPIALSQWFDSTFGVGWQPLEALLIKAKVSPRLRSIYYLRGEGTIKRFKPVRVSDDYGEVALIVAIERDADRKIGVRVQVQPMGAKTTLPPDLKLTLLNEAEQILREVRSHERDDFIQLPRFRGEAQERFSIKIAQKTTSVKEDFTI
jgi:hypothetical protein